MVRYGYGFGIRNNTIGTLGCSEGYPDTALPCFGYKKERKKKLIFNTIIFYLEKRNEREKTERERERFQLQKNRKKKKQEEGQDVGR